MARIGMNPARGKKTDYRPARVTVAVLTHIPHLEGYFKHRLSVLRACLESILRNTETPYDLLVFDNASCSQVRRYLEELQAKEQLDFLLRSSENLGKAGAFKLLFRAAPGEVVAYCDDDFFFFPGWLRRHLEIMDTYERVGAVSGYVVRHLFAEERISSNLAFARSTPEVELERGDLIPEPWVRDWAVSTGRDPEEVLRDQAGGEDLKLEFRGLKAFAAANHDQFVAPKNVVVECLPEEWSGNLMGEMLELDEAIDRSGYLRLATAQRTSQHLGNVLTEDLLDRIPGLGELALEQGDVVEEVRRRGSPLRRVARWAPIRTLLLGLYSRLFDLIRSD